MRGASVGRLAEAAAAFLVAAIAVAGFIAVPHLVHGWAFAIPGTTDSAMAPSFFPRVALAVTATFALAVALTVKMRDDPIPLIEMTRANWLRFLALVAIVVVYLAVLGRIGFIVSSTFLLIVLPFMVGYRRVVPVVATAILLPAAVALVFWYGLKVMLPGGEIATVLAWFS